VGVTALALALGASACTPQMMTDLWTKYQQSNEPTHLWTGGDGTFSVELPDGRIIWLFSDTYLGDVNPDGTRSTAPPIASNTAVVQDVNGGDLLETKAGADNRGFLGSQYWIMDGTVEGSSLRIFANNKGGGTSGIATVSLPGLVPTGTVQSVPSAHPDVSGVILWGGSISRSPTTRTCTAMPGPPVLCISRRTWPACQRGS